MNSTPARTFGVRGVERRDGPGRRVLFMGDSIGLDESWQVTLVSRSHAKEGASKGSPRRDRCAGFDRARVISVSTGERRKPAWRRGRRPVRSCSNCSDRHRTAAASSSSGRDLEPRWRRPGGTHRMRLGGDLGLRGGGAYNSPVGGTGQGPLGNDRPTSGGCSHPPSRCAPDESTRGGAGRVLRHGPRGPRSPSPRGVLGRRPGAWPSGTSKA